MADTKVKGKEVNIKLSDEQLAGLVIKQQAKAPVVKIAFLTRLKKLLRIA